MKRIGIVGGMSWESTALYYRWINELVRAKEGGLSSANIVMVSVDFKPIEEWQRQGKWQKMGEALAAEMKTLEAAGADFIILTSNTMHKMVGQYEAALKVPFLHICDATADRILTAKFNKVGLLGTSYTMEKPGFYHDRLASKGLDVIVPPESDRNEINRMIFEELCQGQINEPSHQKFIQIIRDLVDQGCEAVILGCTEISMIVKPEDSAVPLFDTAKIHCEEAVRMALPLKL